jgi:hypothetical protein
LLPSRRKSSGIYDRSKGGATLLQNLRSGGNVSSKPEKEQRDLRPEQGRGNVAAESAQRGNVASKPAQREKKATGSTTGARAGQRCCRICATGVMLLPSPRSGKKSNRIYDRSKGRATLLQNLRNGGNVASNPEKEQRDLRPEQGQGNVAAESAQRG